MKYDITEYFEGGMIKTIPPCQLGECKNNSLSLVDRAGGGKIFICAIYHDLLTFS